MALGEFELIRRFFAAGSLRRPDTRLGIGDDCALLCPAAGMELAVTTDTLVAGVHFLPEVDPESLGHKALAVNLSDLAAMGAEPAWCTLVLTLPAADEDWLEAFARGFFALADRYGMELVGGDTARGPLAVTLQAMGQVPQGHALRRSGANVGDLIYVSGPLGGAGLGLKMRQGSASPPDVTALAALDRPEPRLELGARLRGLASACIDISDGLVADLGHLLTASQVGAEVDSEKIPVIASVSRYSASTGDVSLPLAAGDDYELCFTVPPSRRDEVDTLLVRLGLQGAVVGAIVASPGLQIHRYGKPLALDTPGYAHFSPG